MCNEDYNIPHIWFWPFCRCTERRRLIWSIRWSTRSVPLPPKTRKMIIHQPNLAFKSWCISTQQCTFIVELSDVSKQCSFFVECSDVSQQCFFCRVVGCSLIFFSLQMYLSSLNFCTVVRCISSDFIDCRWSDVSQQCFFCRVVRCISAV